MEHKAILQQPLRCGTIPPKAWKTSTAASMTAFLSSLSRHELSPTSIKLSVYFLMHV